ncbi:hypothetical protein E2C01_085250 [Portunus trituberculatus]|uniref:Ig-like domain-containing protein n=1 Tax=Portunus trituberculatus TaxID=210409 RepID=A0A5B7J736_PORTR|nr:hypothetical protein [Portunus trituberculatus]
MVVVAARRGATAYLPCAITSGHPFEPPLLVLWYRDSSVTPAYRYGCVILKSNSVIFLSLYRQVHGPAPLVQVNGSNYIFSSFSFHHFCGSIYLIT